MRYEVAVGVFFFVAMLILGYFTIIMSGEIFTPYEYYEMSVIFPNIEGLGENDKVKVNGVVAGAVTTIDLLPTNDVRVYFRMYKEFTLYENFRIKIKNQTALGGKYVSVYPGSAFENGESIVIIKNRKDLKGESVGDALDMLSDLVAENKANVSKTIANLQDITNKINEGKGTLGKLINEDKVHEDADSLVKEIRDTMEDSREQAPITSFIRAALTVF